MDPLRVAVIGAGAFGRNHLRVYREHGTAFPDVVQLVAVVEPNLARREAATAQFDVPGYESVAAMYAANIQLDAASICVPTMQHAATAEDLLERGVDVLIEKPFAASLEEADRVLATAKRCGRIVQVGHLERFNPAVTATIERLNRPMFFEAHRLSVFTPRSLDVDVVLDLMIHDLDIVLALTASPVREVRAVGLPVLSPNVDIANVRIEFDSGCVANFTASRVSTEQVRKLRLFQPRQYLSVDFARQELLSINVGSAPHSSWTEVTHPSASSLAHPSAGLSLEKLELPRAEPLRLEIEDFLHSVRHRSAPRVSGEAGRAALALALEINQQIAAHSKRAGLV